MRIISYSVKASEEIHVRGAVVSLCTATDYANLSVGWRDLYGNDARNCNCHALLYVYRHGADARQRSRKQSPKKASGSKGLSAEYEEIRPRYG